MGYNRADYVRIKAEYSEKYLKARSLADDRKFELYGAIPEVKDIDAVLARTGMDIMAVISAGGKNTDEKIEKIKQLNV